MATSKLKCEGTQVGIGTGSYSMKGPAFYVVDRYGALVKRSVATKTMVVPAVDFVEDLFPESTLKTGGGDGWTWRRACFELQGESHYNKMERKWRNCPDLNIWHVELERNFAEFLNHVAMTCALSMGIKKEPTMRWTAKYSTNILPGHEANRKPDLALFTHGTNDNWRCVRSIGEMKSMRTQTSGFTGLMDQISVKSAIIFGAQDNRNFVLAIGFARYDMVIYKFDRGGVKQCEPFSINGDIGWACFARVIYCLGYGDLDRLGYDSSVQAVPQAGPRYMAMQRPSTPASFDYVVDAQLHLTESLFGRGSNVRRVHHHTTKDRYIVKDTWHNVARPLTEGQILHVIGEIPNVPKVKNEYVVDEDLFSSTITSRIRVMGKEAVYSALHNGRFQDRVHLRLLMEASPIQVISEFQTREELARAFKDCVIAHQQAFERFGVLHSDIHLANMYVKNMDGSLPGQTGGVLGDWGFAECKDMAKVIQHLETMNYAHPTPMPPPPVASPSISSLSMTSSLTPPPTSPEPSQNLHQFLHGTDRTRTAGMAPPNYEESSMSDVEVDIDTKRASAFSLSPDSKLNPWHRRTKFNLAERTGNASSTSIRMMLRAADDQHGGHEVRDDLESIFYVIVLIMVAFEAPGRSKAKNELETLPLHRMWWNPTPEDWTESATWKLSIMKMETLWFHHIADHFSPYFKCWTELINRFRKTIFVHYDSSIRDLNQMCNTEGVTYPEVLDILNEMIEVGAAADKAEVEQGVKQGSPAATQIISDIDPNENDAACTGLFTLEMVDDHPDGLDLTAMDPSLYTPFQALRITESLKSVIATSDLPEGEALPPSDVRLMPTREEILQRSSLVDAPPTIDTAELPSDQSEVTRRPSVGNTIKRKASTPEARNPTKKSRGEVGASTPTSGATIPAASKSRGGVRASTSRVTSVKRSRRGSGAAKRSRGSGKKASRSRSRR